MTKQQFTKLKLVADFTKNNHLITFKPYHPLSLKNMTNNASYFKYAILFTCSNWKDVYTQNTSTSNFLITSI